MPDVRSFGFGREAPVRADRSVAPLGRGFRITVAKGR